MKIDNINGTKDKHMDELLNLRSFYLRLIAKLWTLLLSAVVGAVVGGGIYFLSTVVYSGGRSYEAHSTLMLQFAYDENAKTQVDFYNAYTWKTLIADDDDIVDGIARGLEEQGITVYEDEAFAKPGSDELAIDMEEIKASINADIPSDVRVMVLTVTNQSEQMTNAILKAASDSLVQYGVSNTAFDYIKLLGQDKAKLVTASDRTVVAAVTGAIIFVLASIFILVIRAIMDDAVYVPEDIEKRYQIPCLGVLTAEKAQMPDAWRNELIVNSKQLLSKFEQLTLISAQKTIENTEQTDVISTVILDRFKEVVGSNFDFNQTQIQAMDYPGDILENYRKIGMTDGVIVTVKQGDAQGAFVEHVISQLHKHECPIIGMIMTDADEKFLRRYYRYGKN